MSINLSTFSQTAAPSQRDEHYLDVFVNNMRITMTQSDLSMIFGTTEDYGPGNVGTKDRVCLRISPMMARIILVNLQATLDAYEDIAGQVRLPEALEKAAKAQRNLLAETFKTNL